MSIDYDLLVHRLHRGACAFQSLRAHRRQRGAAPDPATVAEVRAPNPPPTPAPPDPASDPRVTGSREPQAFMAVGGRMVPIFGDVNAVLGAPVAPTGQGAPLMGESPPSPPRATPPPEEPRPTPPSAPAISSSALKLPAPTPPPRLGLIYGGHPRPPAPEPAPTTPTDPSATPGRTIPAADAVAAPSTQEVAATLAAMFATYAQQEAARLEKLHADHRTALATLLQEHREELRARGEAEATRSAELFREVLAEHREELRARSEVIDHDLHAALLEQAKLQREAHEDVAEHISALTTIVADLGQTVGMLAVAAAQEARQSHSRTHPTLAAPPRVEPGAEVPAPAPCLEAAPRNPTPGALLTAPAPASAVSTTSTAANHGEPPTPHRAAHAPASSPPAVAKTAVPTIPTTSQARAVEVPQQPRIRLAQAEEAAARARIQQFADEDRDDDDLATGIDDDDDPPRRRALPPITDIGPPNLREHDHG